MNYQFTIKQSKQFLLLLDLLKSSGNQASFSHVIQMALDALQQQLYLEKVKYANEEKMQLLP
jgi:hypothetical protein